MEFELNLVTQLQAEERCRGIQILWMGGPDKWSLPKNGFWSLSLNFHEGEPKQVWQMTNKKMDVTQGEGSPREIAANVCAIVHGKGATIKQEAE